MADPRKNPRPAGDAGQTDVTPKPIEEGEEEKTDPGVDPSVQAALASLHRVQLGTNRRASGMHSLLIKKKTPLP